MHNYYFMFDIHNGDDAPKKKNNNWDLYRDINEFKNGYKRRTNIVIDKNSDLVAASHSILDMGKK